MVIVDTDSGSLRDYTGSNRGEEAEREKGESEREERRMPLPFERPTAATVKRRLPPPSHDCKRFHGTSDTARYGLIDDATSPCVLDGHPITTNNPTVANEPGNGGSASATAAGGSTTNMIGQGTFGYTICV